VLDIADSDTDNDNESLPDLTRVKVADPVQILKKMKPMKKPQKDMKGPDITIEEIEKLPAAASKQSKQKFRALKVLSQHATDNKDRIAAEEIRQALILKIQRYQNSERFGAFVKKELHINHSVAKLQQMTTEKLENLLIQIRLALDQRGIDHFFDVLATSGVVGLEKCVNPVYECSGFGQRLLANEQFWDCYERIKLEYTMPNIPPHLHMMMLIGTTMVLTHESNKMIRAKEATETGAEADSNLPPTVMKK